MNKVGIDDLLAANGPGILPKLLKDAWKFDGHQRPTFVHLSQIENAALGRKRMGVDLVISAIGETYLLPNEVEIHCSPQDHSVKKPKLHLVAKGGESVGTESAEGTPACASCVHLERNDGVWEVDINSPEILIDLTRTPRHSVQKRLMEFASSRCPNARHVRIKSRQTVTSFLATPKSRRLRSVMANGRIQTVDEVGRAFREKVVYYCGTIESTSRYYRGIGVAIPNPKNQEATAFLWSLDPLADEFESFVITPDFIEKVRVFQTEAGRVEEALRSLAEDITTHITNIYGEHRMRSLLGKLLVFHSARGFSFDGERLKRGWLEMLEIGDTGQGKTQQVDRIIQATGMGEGVDGVSTSRTGLAYAFQKHNDTWYLVWGKYPLNDGKLLFVDEAQNLQPEDIDKIRKGRSDGVIAAAGVRSGEHSTRTRMIATCNPKYQGVVDDQIFGIELVKQTFKDEDVRRFDFAIISSSSDCKADINQPQSEKSKDAQRVSADALEASIQWAWSRREDQIQFIPGATEEVYRVARSLTEVYGEARDIPLLLESDARHKIARIAVATAALLHSTDDRHEQVLVTREHVTWVEEYLKAVYDHPNCSFDLYARNRREEATLSDAEYEAIWSELRECEVDTYKVDGQERGIPMSEVDRMTLLRAFVTHGGLIGRQDLAGELGKSAEWTSKVVRVLKVNKLIRVNRGRSGGYRATPKFSRFLKLAISRKALEA